MGTGINVKTVQAMAFGMPLVTTKVGIKGIETEEPLHNHVSLDTLVKSLLDLGPHTGAFKSSCACQQGTLLRFVEVADQSVGQMFGHPKIRKASGRRCSAAGSLVPLEQFGRPMQRSWRNHAVTALTCSECAYVTFDIPSEAALKATTPLNMGRTQWIITK